LTPRNARQRGLHLAAAAASAVGLAVMMLLRMP